MKSLNVENSTTYHGADNRGYTGDSRKPLTEEFFLQMISLERKRTERTNVPFILMLLDTMRSSESRSRALDRVAFALQAFSRETDIIGWYKHGVTVGVLFTGIGTADKNEVLSVILNRVSELLRDVLTPDEFCEISISFHFFPDDWNNDGPGPRANDTLYPDLRKGGNGTDPLGFKRRVDLCASTVLLLCCSPLLLVIAIAIKLTSKGPVLFRQQRIGQYGVPFNMLKFRSMHVNNDPSPHKEYVTAFITDSPNHTTARSHCGVYKITNDKRITFVGRLLRKTSLDELPQLFNVIKGQMSLIGPRPAIPYELEVYRTWHRNRILAVKPGMTGLWQVTSRSRVRFDEMVRLDLRYASSWTPWLDLQILVRTPLVMIRGDGAY